MPLTTAKYGLPFPEPTDPPDVPADMQRLAEAIVAALDGAYAMLPVGTILAYSPGAAIPPGWALCNGQNGTPNLAGKTLVGSGTATDGTHLAAGQSINYVAGQTGGFAAVKLTDVTSGIGIHQHVGSATVNIPAHSHSIPALSGTAADASTWHDHGRVVVEVSDRDHVHSGWTGGMSQNAAHAHGAWTREGNTAAGDSEWWIDTSDGAQQQPDIVRRNTVGIDATNTDHAHHITTGGQNTGHHHWLNIPGGGGNHSHGVTTAASTTGSAAPVAGGTVSMEASQPKDAQQAHENRMPYYVVQYIMRIA